MVGAKTEHTWLVIAHYSRARRAREVSLRDSTRADIALKRRRMDASLARIATCLPLPLRRAATAARLALLAQFLRFGLVGLVGFAADTATVYALRAELGLYGAGMVSYLVAGTVTWALNRAWTFHGRGGGPVHRQWALFLVANLAGFILNRGTYALLIAFVPAARTYPVIAVFAGAVAGMFSNFSLSRRLVFR